VRRPLLEAHRGLPFDGHGILDLLNVFLYNDVYLSLSMFLPFFTRNRCLFDPPHSLIRLLIRSLTTSSDAELLKAKFTIITIRVLFDEIFYIGQGPG